MNHEEFIEQVRLRRHMGDRREEADIATRDTLETLTERLPKREAIELADRLPPGIADHLEHGRAGAAQELSLEEFFSRVDEKDGVDEPRAVYHARVVMEVLKDIIWQEAMEELIRSRLPSEYAPLFEAGSQSEMDT